MNFSINIGSKRLEALIMTTRTELTAQLAALAETVSTENAQVDAKVDALTANAEALTGVVTMLKDKVAALELAAGTEVDFSAESEALDAIESSIAAIIDPV